MFCAKMEGHVMKGQVLDFSASVTEGFMEGTSLKMDIYDHLIFRNKVIPEKFITPFTDLRINELY